MSGWDTCGEWLAGGRQRLAQLTVVQTLRERWGGVQSPAEPPLLVTVAEAERLAVTAVDDSQQAVVQWTAKGNEAEAVEGLVAAVCGAVERQGWTGRTVSLQVPPDWCMALLSELPTGLSNEEQAEAAYWEMADQLGSSGLEAENYAIASCALPTGALWTAAVPRARLAKLRAAAEAANLPLVRLWAGPATDGRAQAVLWQPVRDAPYVRYLRWGVAVLVVLLLGFGLGRDLCAFYTARQARQAAEAQLSALATDQRAMAVRQAVHQRAMRKAQVLHDLSVQRQPWYSLLVHLGTVVPEGVWLEQVQLAADGSCRLQGRAVDYPALTHFLQGCEQTEGFFTQLPQLEEARQGEDGSLTFRLRLQL